MAIYSNKIWALAIVTSLLFFAQSCKKEENSAFGISGKYRVVYYSGIDSLPEYYIFNDDKTYTQLAQNYEAAKEIWKGVYQFTEPSLVLSRSASVYLVKRSGDTLKLIDNPSAGDESNLILVKENNAPSENDWVQSVTVTTKLLVPGVADNTNITVLNGKIYTCYQYEAMLRVFNLTDGQALAPLATTNQYYGITTAGNSLWGVTSSGELKKLNPVNGNEMFTAAAPTYDYDIIASDGANIYEYNINSGRFNVYNIAGDSHGTDKTLSIDIRSMVYKGGYIYGSNYSYIYKIDPATLNIVKSFSVKDVPGVSSLAWDGTNFWIYVSDELDAPAYFGKISLD